MDGKPPEIATALKEERRTPVVSARLPDGTIVETCYRAEEARTAFALWREGAWTIAPDLRIGPRERLVPYSPRNNLLRNEVVLLPSAPEEYGTVGSLTGEIASFIHRYVDVSALFETIAAYYVLLSWVYDAFNELPYLRLRGDPGSGKTRFLLIVGSLCYKPIFASGASTVSPLFRILDAFRGTLVIDEGDFRLSDERAEIVKILNNGNARGFPVLRTEVSPRREYNPTAYQVFGPKIVATRGYFEDRALESRCLTEEMGLAGLREDVPINLPSSWKEEALRLRNKLLLFRFRHLDRCGTSEELVDRTIEPRLAQIFVPLLSVIEDPAARQALQSLARRYDRDLITERGMEMEAQVLEVIRDILASDDTRLTVKDITRWFADRHGEDYDRKITPKWIGWVIRRKLRLRTRRIHGVFEIAPEEVVKLKRLSVKYGLEEEESRASEPAGAPPSGAAGSPATGGHGDVG